MRSSPLSPMLPFGLSPMAGPAWPFLLKCFRGLVHRRYDAFLFLLSFLRLNIHQPPSLLWSHITHLFQTNLGDLAYHTSGYVSSAFFTFKPVAPSSKMALLFQKRLWNIPPMLVPYITGASWYSERTYPVWVLSLFLYRLGSLSFFRVTTTFCFLKTPVYPGVQMQLADHLAKIKWEVCVLLCLYVKGNGVDDVYS